MERQSIVSKLQGTRQVAIQDTATGVLLATAAVPVDPYMGAAAQLPARVRRRPRALAEVYDVEWEDGGGKSRGRRSRGCRSGVGVRGRRVGR